MLDKDILISQNQDLIASLSMICGVCGVSAKSLSLVVPGDYNAVEFRICLLDEVLKLNEFFFICDECLSLVLRCTSGLSFVDHLRSLSQFEFVRGCFLCGSNNLLNKFQITYDFSSLMALIRFNLQYTFRTEVLHNICPPCEELYTDLTNLYHVIRNNPKYPGDEVAAKEKKRIPSTKKYNTFNDEMIANLRLESRSNNILQGEDTKTINDSRSVSLSTTEEQHNLKEIMEQFQQYTVSQCTTTTSTSTRNDSRIDVGWETYDTSETTTNKRSYLGESVQEGDIEETLQEKKEAVVKEEKEIEEEQEGEEKDIQEEAEERMEQGRIKKYKVEEEELRDEELNEEYEYEFDDYEEEEEHDESQSNMQGGEDDQFEELYEEEEEESHQTPEFLQSQKNKVEEIQSDIYALRDTPSEKHSNSTTDRSFTTFKNSSKNDLEHNCLKRILSKNNIEDLLMKTHPQFHTDAKSTSIREILDAHQQTKLQQDKNDLIAKQNPLYTEKNIEEEEIRNEAEKDKEVNGEYDYEFNDYEEQDEDQNKVHTEEEDEVDDLSEEKQEGHQTTDIESPQPDQNKKMQVFAIPNTPSKNLLNPSTAKVNTNISYSSSSFNCKDVKKNSFKNQAYCRTARTSLQNTSQEVKIRGSSTTSQSMNTNVLQNNRLKQISDKKNIEDPLKRTQPQFYTDGKSSTIREILETFRQTKLQQTKNDSNTLTVLYDKNQTNSCKSTGKLRTNLIMQQKQSLNYCPKHKAYTKSEVDLLENNKMYEVRNLNKLREQSIKSLTGKQNSLHKKEEIKDEEEKGRGDTETHEEVTGEYENEFDDYDEEEKQDKAQNKIQTEEESEYEDLDEEKMEDHLTPEIESPHSQKNKVEQIRSEILQLLKKMQILSAPNTFSENHLNSSTRKLVTDTSCSTSSLIGRDVKRSSLKNQAYRRSAPVSLQNISQEAKIGESFANVKTIDKNDLKNNCLKRIPCNKNIDDPLKRTQPQFYTDGKPTTLKEILETLRQSKLQQTKNDSNTPTANVTIQNINSHQNNLSKINTKFEAGSTVQQKRNMDVSLKCNKDAKSNTDHLVDIKMYGPAKINKLSAKCTQNLVNKQSPPRSNRKETKESSPSRTAKVNFGEDSTTTSRYIPSVNRSQKLSKTVASHQLRSKRHQNPYIK